MTTPVEPFFIPPVPTEPESLVGVEESLARYEDISQDGRLRLEGIWHPTGRLLWSNRELGATLLGWGRDHGIRTVLTRVVLEAHDERLAPRHVAHTELRHRFERVVGNDGGVERLCFTTWLGTDAPVVGGVDDERLPVAKAYGQRTFARLDAPPGERLVKALPGLGGGVPEHTTPFVDAEGLLELPPGAVALDDGPRCSSLRVVFGLSHTDANQHVNFLAYPRYLEQAALGHFDELGVGAAIMARRVELAYRRPSFAGETIAVVLRAFRLGDDVGVCAAFVDAVGAGASFAGFGKPRCTARMLLRR